MAMGLPWQEVVAMRTARCFHAQPLPATPPGSLGPLNLLPHSAALSPPWYISGPSVLLSTFCAPLPPSLPHPTPLSSFLLPAFSPLPMPPHFIPHSPFFLPTLLLFIFQDSSPQGAGTLPSASQLPQQFRHVGLSERLSWSISFTRI